MRLSNNSLGARSVVHSRRAFAAYRSSHRARDPRRARL